MQAGDNLKDYEEITKEQWVKNIQETHKRMKERYGTIRDKIDSDDKSTQRVIKIRFDGCPGIIRS